MILETIETVDTKEMIQRLGGFWAALSGVGFLALNYFLYNYFFVSTIDKILLLEKKERQEEASAEDESANMTMNMENEALRKIEIKNRFKERLSFLGIYNLYDKLSLQGDLTQEALHRVKKLEMELE